MFHINYFTYLNKTLNSNNNLNCNANWPTILLPPRVYLHEINFKHEMSKNREGERRGRLVRCPPWNVIHLSLDDMTAPHQATRQTVQQDL